MLTSLEDEFAKTIARRQLEDDDETARGPVKQLLRTEFFLGALTALRMVMRGRHDELIEELAGWIKEGSRNRPHA